MATYYVTLSVTNSATPVIKKMAEKTAWVGCCICPMANVNVAGIIVKNLGVVVSSTFYFRKQVSKPLSVGSGSRNLLRYHQSNCSDASTDFWTYYSGTTGVVTTEEAYGESDCIKVSCQGLSNREGIYTALGSNFFKPYVTHTGSIAIKVPLGKEMALQITDNTDKATTIYHTGTGDWVKLSITHTTDAHTTFSLLVRSRAVQGAFDFYIAEAQVEEGTVATKWTSGNFFTVNQQSVEQDLSGLTFWVENTGTQSFIRDTAVKYLGTASAKITSNFNGSQSITLGTEVIYGLTPGKTYTANVKIKNNRDNGGYLVIRFRNAYGGVIAGVQEWVSIGSTWTICQVSGVAPEGTTSCDVFLNCVYNQGDSTNWDDAWLYTKSSTSYFNLVKEPRRVLLSTAQGLAGVVKGASKSLGMTVQSNASLGNNLLKSLKVKAISVAGIISFVYLLEIFRKVSVDISQECRSVLHAVLESEVVLQLRSDKESVVDLEKEKKGVLDLIKQFIVREK